MLCCRVALVALALAILGSDAGAGGAADEDFLLEYVGGRVADVGTGLDDLVGLEAHLAAGVADMGDFAVGFDIVAGVDGGLEFDHVVGAEETFVAVLDDEELGGDIAKEVEHVGAVDEVSTVVGVLGAHADAEHRLNCHNSLCFYSLCIDCFRLQKYTFSLD